MHLWWFPPPPPPLSLSFLPLSPFLSVVAVVVVFMVFYNSSSNNNKIFSFTFVSCCLGLVWFWFLFDRSAYRIVFLLACLIGQLLYLALFDCFFVFSPDRLFSLYLVFVYFSPLGLSLFQRVTAALPGTARSLYTCISMRVFLLSPPPPPPPSLSLPSVCPSVCLFACLPACLSVCLSVCLSDRLLVCLFVRFCLPSPPPPSLSLSSSPLSLYFPPSFPPVFCVPSWFFLCFFFVLFFCGCFVFSLFFSRWILNTSRARFKRM